MILELYIWAALLGLLNGLAVLLVNPGRAINQIYLLGTLITALWYYALFETIALGMSTPRNEANEQLLFWLRMNSAAPAFIVWQIAMMRCAISQSTSNIGQAFRCALPWFGVSSALATLSYSEYFVPSHSTTETQLLGPGYAIYMICICVSGLALLVKFSREARRSDGIRRLELQFFVAYAVCASLAVIFSTIVSRIFPQLEWLRRVGPFWIMIWQGSIVWALCHHKIFEGRQVMLLVGQRLVLLAVSCVAALGLVLTLTPALDESLALFAAVAFATGMTALLDRPMRRAFGLDTKYQLTAPRNQVLSWARSGLDEERLSHRITDLLKEWCKTDSVHIWPLETDQYGFPQTLGKEWRGWKLLTKEGWVTPESLQRQKNTVESATCHTFLSSQSLGALLAVPKGNPTPSLLLGLGKKLSLRPYTYPDIQLLLELAESIDNALMHARFGARVAQIDKMESAAMMSRSLAHDLNNLATPVSTFLLHMESRVQAGTTEAEVLSDAKHSLRVMQDYIRESLFFARRLVPDIRATSSSALLSSTMKVTQARASARGVTVQVESGSDISFAADPTLLQRLLQNLVLNGIDATPRGGRVTLSAAQVGNDRVRFRIEDEGPGVPAELREKIFEPYFTTKDTGDKVRGLGLGLAVSKKIADLHGGVIQIDRAASGGASFSVLFPLRAPGAR